MPNHVMNILEIHCPDEKTMIKIKKVIFDINNLGEQVFTMERLLPIPAGLSGRSNFSEYGKSWRNAIWGTKWDAYDCSISESGSTITIYYNTAWSPNNDWCLALCNFVQQTINFAESEEVNSIRIKHKFFEYSFQICGMLDWITKVRPEYKDYSSVYFKTESKEIFSNES